MCKIYYEDYATYISVSGGHLCLRHNVLTHNGVHYDIDTDETKFVFDLPIHVT